VTKRLINFEIDFIYSSTYTRAFQTAEIASKTLKIPIETWDKIIEVKTPSINWGKSADDETALKIDREIEKNYHKGNWKYSDEETFEEIHVRAQEVLNHLLEKHKDQNVLCVSHASFIKMIVLTAIIGTELNPIFYSKFRHHSWLNNSGITTLDYSQKYGWVLETLNDKSHL
jgi:probable phosphoglycerate mutase